MEEIDNKKTDKSPKKEEDNSEDILENNLEENKEDILVLKEKPPKSNIHRKQSVLKSAMNLLTLGFGDSY